MQRRGTRGRDRQDREDRGHERASRRRRLGDTAVVGGPCKERTPDTVLVWYRYACEREFKPLRFHRSTLWVQARRWLYAHLGLAKVAQRGGVYGSQILRGYREADWAGWPVAATLREVDDLAPVAHGDRFVLAREFTSEKRTRDDVLRFDAAQTEEDRLAILQKSMTREWVTQPRRAAREQRVQEEMSARHEQAPLGIPASSLRLAETEEEKARAYVNAQGQLVVPRVEFASGIMPI